MLLGALIIGLATGGTAGALTVFGIGAPLWVGLVACSIYGSSATVLALVLLAFPYRAAKRKSERAAA
ncbi:MAG: hypothetical protein R3E44_08320 [Paracoccaceae bacterium]